MSGSVLQLTRDGRRRKPVRRLANLLLAAMEKGQDETADKAAADLWDALGNRLIIVPTGRSLFDALAEERWQKRAAYETLREADIDFNPVEAAKALKKKWAEAATTYATERER